MDYPILSPQHYNISNNWWFLPTDVGQEETENQHRESPILAYLDNISGKNKFKYIILSIIILFIIYRLRLSATLWIGLVVAILVVYYLNERNAQLLNDQADQLWVILKGPLLHKTKYFITDPELIQWVDQIGELKKYNIIEFNNMIQTLDHFLHVMYDLRRGVKMCRENIEIMLDLKTTSLNQFHSLVHNLRDPLLREKCNYYLEQMGKLLNDRYASVIRVCQNYYTLKPVDINSHFATISLDDPIPMDHMYDPHYNFYN